MKKIISILSTVLLVITTVCAPVSAVDNVDVKIDISLYDISVAVTTDVVGTVTAQLTSDDKSVFYGMYSDSTPTEDDGEYIYNFQFRLPDKTDSVPATTGKYRLRLGNSITTEDTVFSFATPEDRVTFYNELNDKSVSEMYEFLTVDRRSFVTVDLTEYSALTGNILSLVNGKIVEFGTSYEDITVNDTVALTTIEENFKSTFTSAMSKAKMATVTEDEWAEFADDMLDSTIFDGKYYTDTTNADSLFDVVELYPYYKTEIEEIEILEVAEYSKAFDKATLHLIEETAGYEAFKTAFLYFENKGVITPDMTNINALINAGKDVELWKSVMANANTNCTDIVNKAVSEAQTMVDNGVLTSTPSVGGNGGGGGGAGGSASIDKPVVPSGSGTVSGGNTSEIKPLEPVTTGKFADVSKNHWAYDAIEKLADKGILNGKGDGSFAPDSGVTREEFVKIIVVAFDLNVEAENTFSDVASDRWSAGYIASAAALGIVNGDGANFNPTNVITRQEMAVIIHRVFEHLEAEVSGEAVTFDDDSEIADYAKSAVETLTAAGIINGMGDGTFAPKATVTRAQSAKVVYGLLDLYGGGK